MYFKATCAIGIMFAKWMKRSLFVASGTPVETRREGGAGEETPDVRADEHDVVIERWTSARKAPRGGRIIGRRVAKNRVFSGHFCVFWRSPDSRATAPGAR
jgi:hypothetical protein